MKSRIILIAGLILINIISSKAQQTGSFVDTRDGKAYETVKIGDQTWIAENLTYSYGKRCTYKNNKDNLDKYGYLYYVEAVHNKICPDGWGIPSKSDFENLLDNFGSEKKAFKGLSQINFLSPYPGYRWDNFKYKIIR